MIKQYKLRFYNFRLVVFLLAISFIGIHLVGTAADYLRTRQLLGVIIGVVFMLTLSLMDYSWLLNFQWIMYGFNIVMLLAVRFFGSSAMPLSPKPPKPILLVARWMRTSLMQPPPKPHREVTSRAVFSSLVKR